MNRRGATLMGQESPRTEADIYRWLDHASVDEAVEKAWEQQLRSVRPNVPWSVKNQARMHVINGQKPYTSAFDGMSKFPETATAIGVRLLDDGHSAVFLAHIRLYCGYGG